MTPVPPSDTIRSADNLRDVAHAKSHTAGSIIDTLDSVAFTLGSMRLSLWDAVVGMSLILIVITAAWSTSKVCGTLLRRATRLDETQRVMAHKITTILIWTFAFFEIGRSNV